MNDLPLFAVAANQVSGQRGRHTPPKSPRCELPAGTLRAVEQTIAESQGMFSAESVRDRLSVAVRDVLQTRPNALGQVFMRLARDGKIEHAGWGVAHRDNARGRALRLSRVRPP